MSANIWRRPNKSVPDVTITKSLLLNLLYSNMTSFFGHINNTAIKLPLYFNSLMRIDEQIINIITKWMYSYMIVVHTSIIILVLLLDIYFFPEKILLRRPLIDFDFCYWSFSGNVVYDERWWHWYMLITDLFYNFVSILIVWVAKCKMP